MLKSEDLVMVETSGVKVSSSSKSRQAARRQHIAQTGLAPVWVAAALFHLLLLSPTPARAFPRNPDITSHTLRLLFLASSTSISQTSHLGH